MSLHSVSSSDVTRADLEILRIEFATALAKSRAELYEAMYKSTRWMFIAFALGMFAATLAANFVMFRATVALIESNHPVRPVIERNHAAVSLRPAIPPQASAAVERRDIQKLPEVIFLN